MVRVVTKTLLNNLMTLMDGARREEEPVEPQRSEDVDDD